MSIASLPPAATIRCTAHNYPSTASWLELTGVCSCVTAVCVTESDGFHQHDYWIGASGWYRIVVTEHLHTWMVEHLANHPGTQPVSIQNGSSALRYVATLDDAWRELADTIPGVPTIVCKEVAA